MKAIYVVLLASLCTSPVCFSQYQKLTELVATADLLDGFGYQGIHYAKKGKHLAAYTAMKSALHRSRLDGRGKDTCTYHIALVCLMSDSRSKWKEGLAYLKSVSTPAHFSHYWENLSIAYMLNGQLAEARLSVGNVDTASAASWFLQGLIHIELKEYEKAAHFFRKAENAGGELPFFEMAEAKYRSRGSGGVYRHNDVIKWLVKAGNSYDNKYAVTLAEAIVRGEAGEYNKSLRLLNRLNPSDSAVAYATALTYFRAGKDSLAKMTLKKMAKSHPGFPDLQMLLGHIYVRQASLKKNPDLWFAGITHYSKAIVLDPKPEYYEMRALTWLQLFDYQKTDSDSCIVKALSDFRHVKNLRPGYEFSYESVLAEARAWHYVLYSLVYKKHQSGYFSKGNLPYYIANAAAGYEKAIAKDSSRLDALEGLGTLNKDIQKPEISLAYFLKSGSRRPSEDNLMGAGMAYLEMDSLSKAGLYFQKAAALNPLNANAVMGQGLVLLKKPATEKEGVELIEKAYAMRDKVSDDITKASIIFNYAFSKTYHFSSSGYPQTADGFKAYANDSIRPVYQEAGQVTPLADSSVYFVNLGWYAEELKFTDLAAEYYHKSQTAHASNNYALLLAKNNQVANAVAILEKIEDRLDVAKTNLGKIRAGKQRCSCLRVVNFSYLHTAYQPQIVAPRLTNHFFPKGSRVYPVTDFYPFYKPHIVKRYGRGGVSRKKSDPTDCPFKKG
jgi:Tfp pilus assembly protein PilF